MALTIKQRTHKVIEAVSDDATWQELLCALELRFDVEAGLADAKAGRVTDTYDLRGNTASDNEGEGGTALGASGEYRKFAGAGGSRSAMATVTLDLRRT